MTTTTATARHTTEVSEANFLSLRRDILALGGTITTSVFTARGFRVTYTLPA